jgi:autotransporter-associated beta strand protein
MKKLATLRLIRLVPLTCVLMVGTVLFGLPLHALAQSTYNWNTTTNSTAWLNSSNWTGGLANKFPGVDAHAGTTADGNAGDIAVFGSMAFSGNNVGINFNNTSNNSGNGNNGNANGSLSLGAIVLSATANKNLTIGKSDTSTFSATLTLNGATVNSINNVILLNADDNSLTLAGFAGGSGTAPMTLALGNATDNVVNIDSTGGINVGVAITGSGRNLTLNAPGTGVLTFSGSAANTYSGLTTVNTGTLILQKTAGVNAVAGNIKIGNGTAGGTARAQLNANNQFANTSAVELAGGTLALNNFSEGAPGVTGIGALTLSATSTIDFGSGTTSVIQFAGVTAQAPGTILHITNWAGNMDVGGSGNQLLFAGSSSDFTNLFGYKEVTFNGQTGYQIFEHGTYYEVAAVPEPGTYVAGALALLGLGYVRRRDFGALLRKRAS